MADECEHGEPLGPAFACPPCQTTPRPARRLLIVSPAFPARFPGRCAVCDAAIVVGSTIRIDDGDPIHDGCLDRL